MAILISPMIVPLIISAAGMYFFYSRVGIAGHLCRCCVSPMRRLGTPFVIITVTATLVGFDKSLTRAAANMGANPVTTFFRVQMPLIIPGVVSGALFAFITSFDEVVVVLFLGSAATENPAMADVYRIARTDFADHSGGCDLDGGDLHCSADGA